ncbi:hypothetical protein B0H11DRAFT_2082010 [Mycena galericulata]|nr:hypothetical protein B0H11DRAFT_2082010 [Mycena galericulata]
MATHHTVAMLPPAWGHTASYMYLAIQMLQLRPNLVITLVQHNCMVAQMEAELSTCAYDSARLRIIGVGEKGVQVGLTTFKLALGQLLGGWIETIPKLAKGSDGWPKPQALHLDFACGGLAVEPTKQIFGPDCKILVWFSTALVSMPGHLNDYDFAAIAEDIYADPERHQDRSLEEILEAVGIAWNGTDKVSSGRIIKCPGIPDMYDYERVGYGAGRPEGMSHLLSAAQKLAKAADGYIVPTATCIEPVGVPQCKDFYQKQGQELFTVGLQAHDLAWTDSEAPPAPPTNAVIKSFLDNAVKQNGARSVLYISFGSFFFPITTPELVEALVTTLLDLENPFPFIFVLGAKLATLPKELVERVNTSGRGLVCGFWVEQRAILQHGAVGWILTHGGFNTVTEALSQGIPLIVWPINAEQPVNAALLTSEPTPVAFEFFQVRQGPQRGPPLRSPALKITGTVEDAAAEFKATLEAARGARGAVLTRNARDMARKLREARDGQAREEITRLAAF